MLAPVFTAAWLDLWNDRMTPGLKSWASPAPFKLQEVSGITAAEQVLEKRQNHHTKDVVQIC